MTEYRQNNSYTIYVENENGLMIVPISEKGQIKTFDCRYGAETYAKRVGLKQGYQICKTPQM